MAGVRKICGEWRERREIVRDWRRGVGRPERGQARVGEVRAREERESQWRGVVWVVRWTQAREEGGCMVCDARGGSQG